MKITGSENEKVILMELGRRIKQNRIALGLTQADLALRCGISSCTETRIEAGLDTKISNYIKLLSGLGMLGNLDLLISEIQPDFRSLYERKKPRQRVRTGRSKQEPAWTWGEDKE